MGRVGDRVGKFHSDGGLVRPTGEKQQDPIVTMAGTPPQVVLDSIESRRSHN